MEGLLQAIMAMLYVYLVLVLIMIAGMWAAYAKAGQPGWAVLIPIYNLVVMLEIAEKPIWWIILLLIPFVNLIVGIMLYAAFAEKYGCGGGMVVGLIFLPFVFWPVLGFGSAEYHAGGSIGSKKRRLAYEDD